MAIPIGTIEGGCPSGYDQGCGVLICLSNAVTIQLSTASPAMLYRLKGDLVSNIQIPGTDADLRAALADVNLPTLLMVMTQLAGDDRWMIPRYQPAPIQVPEGSLFPDDSGDFSDEIANEILNAAFDGAMCQSDPAVRRQETESAASEVSVGGTHSRCHLFVLETHKRGRLPRLHHSHSPTSQKLGHSFSNSIPNRLTIPSPSGTPSRISSPLSTI